MILLQRCDKCGATGTVEQIPHRSILESDLCDACYRAAKIEDLKREIAETKDWLESTHLKKLRELEKELEELQRS